MPLLRIPPRCETAGKQRQQGGFRLYSIPSGELDHRGAAARRLTMTALRRSGGIPPLAIRGSGAGKPMTGGTAVHAAGLERDDVS
jgi:hypothetical protein